MLRRLCVWYLRRFHGEIPFKADHARHLIHCVEDLHAYEVRERKSTKYLDDAIAEMKRLPISDRSVFHFW